MFKTYLESKLDEKTKELESKSKLDKQVTQTKFKGNQKQFELNAQGGVAQSMVSFNHWLSGIKTNTLSRY